MSKEAMKLVLEALEAADWYINQLEITLYSADDAGTHEDRLKVQQAITVMRLEIDALNMASKLALAEQPAQQEPVALEAVYETIIHWDEGGEKRSRRELARRIVSLYHASPHCKPLTDEAIATVYWGATGQSLRPQDNVLAHNFARSIEAAHGIKENT